MKASVRCEALDLKGLARAERHGKRDDWISKQRRVRNVPALTLGGEPDGDGLNLADLYAAHIEGAKVNKAANKTVLHFLIHYPEEVLADGGPVPGFAALTPEEREKRLLEQAVDFVNRTHGGEAVFAARLDRDEAGRTNVDVFATPKYLKPSKSGKREPSLWISSTRFGEALARKHQDHIRERLDKAEVKTDRDGNPIPLTSPRAVGMALQEEFHEFFAAVNGVALEERTLKEARAKDRVEVEEWRLRQMRDEAAQAIQQREEARAAQRAAEAAAAEAQAEADAAKVARADAEARMEAARQERDAARQEAEDAKEEAKRALAAMKAAQAQEQAAKAHTAEIAAAGVVLVDEMKAERVHFRNGREDRIKFDNPDAGQAILPGLPELEPLVFAAAAIQRDRDEKRAFIARQVDNLAAVFHAIRSAVPVVRRMLQSPATPPKERAEAKVARREIVLVNPIARSALNKAREDARLAGVLLTPAQPVEEAPASPDEAGGFGRPGV